jgi:hypothetical protein
VSVTSPARLGLIIPFDLKEDGAGGGGKGWLPQLPTFPPRTPDRLLMGSQGPHGLCILTSVSRPPSLVSEAESSFQPVSSLVMSPHTLVPSPSCLGQGWGWGWGRGSAGVVCMWGPCPGCTELGGAGSGLVVQGRQGTGQP